MESDDDFFKRLDALGGWPAGKLYVTMIHTVDTKRPCIFTDKPMHDEWYTTFHSADDYYWWKISPAGKDNFRRAGMKISNTVTWRD
jgi:hypothetical protein